MGLKDTAHGSIECQETLNCLNLKKLAYFISSRQLTSQHPCRHEQLIYCQLALVWLVDCWGSPGFLNIPFHAVCNIAVSW